jgi:hypothetical protein
MPFTLAHPAAALPLRRVRALPMDALVIGTMLPDISLFGRFAPPYALTHSLQLALPVDLPWGLCILWLARLARPSTVWLMPKAVRSRVPDHAPRHATSWLAASIGLAIGIVTHLAWDSFTHGGRMAVRTFHVLSGDWIAAAPLGPLPGYKVLQYASSVLGMLALALIAGARLRRQPIRHVETSRAASRIRLTVWTLVLVVGPLYSLVHAYWVARRMVWAFRPVLTHVFAGTALMIASVVLLAFAAARAWYAKQHA